MNADDGKPVPLCRELEPDEEKLYRSFGDRPRTLPHMLELRARTDGDREAVVAPDGRMTFSEWAAGSARAARSLADRGVQPGDCVGIWAGNLYGCSWITAALAIEWVGAIPVPVNSRMPLPKAAQVLPRLNAKLVIVPSDSVEDVPAGLGPLSLDELVEASGPPMQVLAEEHEPVAIFHTSGTTGPAKAAVLSHRCFAFCGAVTEEHILGAPAGIEPLGPEDVIQTSIPLHTTSAFEHYILVSLFTGCKIVLEERFGAESTVETMLRERSTIWLSVPTMMVLVADRYSSPIEGSSFRVVWHMGSMATPESIDAMRTLFSGAAVLNLYSMTETGAGIVSCTATDAIDSPSTVGRPVPNARVRIVTLDGRDASPGERGEIWFETAEMFDGYWGNQEASAAPWTKDGWFRTGDGGYFDEKGLLYVTGRLGDVIIRGGFNITPSVVEQALQGFSGITDAAVVPVPHRVLGQDLVAVVVSKQALDLEALRGHCRARLADYEVPRTVLTVGSLPRNDFGKLDRTRIRAMAEEQYVSHQAREGAR